jgi:Cu/Ag efflux protein CusF
MIDGNLRARRAVIVAGTLAISVASIALGAADVRAQGGMQKMDGMPGMGGAQKMATAFGTGTVTAVSGANRKITLDHGPIPAIQWPAMKMEFAVAPSVDLGNIKTGDKVNFTLKGSGNTYTVQSVSPAK